MQSPPLSFPLSHAGERGKNKSHYFPFFNFPSFLKMGDFIYVKKVKQKNFFIFYKNLLSLREYDKKMKQLNEISAKN